MLPTYCKMVSNISKSRVMNMKNVDKYVVSPNEILRIRRGKRYASLINLKDGDLRKKVSYEIIMLIIDELKKSKYIPNMDLIIRDYNIMCQQKNYLHSKSALFNTKERQDGSLALLVDNGQTVNSFVTLSQHCPSPMSGEAQSFELEVIRILYSNSTKNKIIKVLNKLYCLSPDVCKNLSPNQIVQEAVAILVLPKNASSLMIKKEIFKKQLLKGLAFLVTIFSSLRRFV
ncbi:hypothetical protein AB837_00045 [bacterium AB1]|nr:hypothetical protein AB837_00045 [bacterium AB1]